MTGEKSPGDETEKLKETNSGERQEYRCKQDAQKLAAVAQFNKFQKKNVSWIYWHS